MDRVGNMMGGRLLASVIPVMCGIIGAFVDNLPISIMGPWVPSPLFSLMPLYYWCLVRPDLMTPAWAFLIGATEDILSGGPPGVWAASFVATYAIIDRRGVLRSIGIRPDYLERVLDALLAEQPR